MKKRKGRRFVAVDSVGEVWGTQDNYGRMMVMGIREAEDELECRDGVKIFELIEYKPKGEKYGKKARG